MTIDRINGLTKDDFVEELGRVYEGSSWIAERAWSERPFASLDDLFRKMDAEVEAATEEEKLALLRAHPELGTRMKVSAGSASEQAGAGLDRLTQDVYEQMLALNDAYREKFAFPFIYAVRGSGPSDILYALRVRIDSDPETEFQAALWEVSRIARFRLEDIVK